MQNFNSFEEFAKCHEGDAFRFWTYRRMFTPYELENKFMDESWFEDVHADCGYIESTVKLPDGDVLICFRDVDDVNITYMRKLSEIRFELVEANEDGSEY